MLKLPEVDSDSMDNAATILCTILGSCDYQTVTARSLGVVTTKPSLHCMVLSNRLLDHYRNHATRSVTALPPDSLSDDHDRHDGLPMLLHGFQPHLQGECSYHSLHDSRSGIVTTKPLLHCLVSSWTTIGNNQYPTTGSIPSTSRCGSSS